MTPLSHLILLSISDGARHGYGILKEIERVSDGDVSPRAGSLYAALDRLRGEGLIEVAPNAGQAGEDARRVYYRITAAGRDALDAETWRLARLLDVTQRKRPSPRPRFTLALEDP